MTLDLGIEAGPHWWEASTLKKNSGHRRTPPPPLVSEKNEEVTENRRVRKIVAAAMFRGKSTGFITACNPYISRFVQRNHATVKLESSDVVIYASLV